MSLLSIAMCMAVSHGEYRNICMWESKTSWNTRSNKSHLLSESCSCHEELKYYPKPMVQNTVHCLYAIMIRKSHGGTELLQHLSFAMPMDMLQEHSSWRKPLLMGASHITAPSCLAGKLGFQVHFRVPMALDRGLFGKGFMQI